MTELERPGMVDDLLARVVDLGKVDLTRLLELDVDEIRRRSVELVAGVA
jgi:hypothetical protein